MILRIATWNMNHWQRTPDARLRAWRYLQQELKVGIALLQEARPPAGLTDAVIRPDDPKIGSHRDWGSVVACFDPKIDLRDIPVVRLGQRPGKGELEESHPGAVCAVEAILPGRRKLALVSFYGLMELAGNGVSYATTTVHRSLSDLTPILDLARSKNRRLVMGGDLNCSTQIPPPDREAHKAVFARIAAFGLVDLLERTRASRERLSNCMCDEAGRCSHVRTQRHRNNPRSRPWQTDYLFASSNMADRLHTAEAWDRTEAWRLSDHCPVVAEFEL